MVLLPSIGLKLLLGNYRDKVTQTLTEEKTKTRKVVRAIAKSTGVSANLWIQPKN